MRAALIYQHNTEGADRKIADAVEALITEHENTPKDDEDDPDDGAEGAPVPAA